MSTLRTQQKYQVYGFSIPYLSEADSLSNCCNRLHLLIDSPLTTCINQKCINRGNLCSHTTMLVQITSELCTWEDPGPRD
jgi:hypothetical protein